MSKRNDATRKLKVKKETLRTLEGADLEQVQGGYIPPKNNCTGRLSGCISCI
jgi:hypothetical protein